MGACGCGEGYNYRLRAPTGWYLIKVYPGCVDCDAPAGFHIDHFASEDGDGFAEWTPDYDIDGSGLGRGIPVVSHDSIKAALLAECPSLHDPEDPELTVAELIDCDDLHERIFRHAVGHAIRAGFRRGDADEAMGHVLGSLPKGGRDA